MAADQGDKDRASAAEQAIKLAMTVGIPSFAEPTTTLAQYTPGGSNLGRDVNRASSAGLFEAMRSLPVRLPIYTVATVPDAAANTGALIYVSNGGAGSPCVAFSNGSAWKRCDSIATTIST